MIRIILIGYMGAGKTTIGKALAKELNVPFYDLDCYIISRMRKTVAQIFEARGQEGFREIEKNMLLYMHLKMSKNDRPLLRGKSQEELITFIREQLQLREPFYTKARYTLDVTLMDDYEKIKISVAKIRELLNI